METDVQREIFETYQKGGGAQSWHLKRYKVRLEIHLKRRKIEQTSKQKREPRTGSEEGEIECSLFEWLSDLSL